MIRAGVIAYRCYALLRRPSDARCDRIFVIQRKFIDMVCFLVSLYICRQRGMKNAANVALPDASPRCRYRYRGSCCRSISAMHFRLTTKAASESRVSRYEITEPRRRWRPRRFGHSDKSQHSRCKSRHELSTPRPRVQQQQDDHPSDDLYRHDHPAGESSSRSRNAPDCITAWWLLKASWKR